MQPPGGTQKRASARFAIKLGMTLAVLAVAFGPLLWEQWRDRVQRVSPLLVTFPVQQGEYRSPVFRPTEGDDYQIDLEFRVFSRPPLRLTWKVVDGQGAVLAQGQYAERTGVGNGVALSRSYTPPVNSAQQIVLEIQSVQQYAATLHVEEPEQILGSSYALPLFMAWAVLVVGVCCCVLLALVLVRRSRRTDWPRYGIRLSLGARS